MEYDNTNRGVLFLQEQETEDILTLAATSILMEKNTILVVGLRLHKLVRS